MADIELLIKIPEEVYKRAKETPDVICDSVWSGMKYGTPLPKGHGRLIDAEDLDITTITTDDYSGNKILDVVLKEDIDIAPTIIEADKENKEWQS